MSKINGKFVNILNIQQGLSLENLSMLAKVESASIAELTQVSSYKVVFYGNA
jgi:purine-binding chemotaxis protein CheW